jgi:hypothetical protein
MFAFVVRGDFQVAVGGMLYPMLIASALLRGSQRRALRRSAVATRGPLPSPVLAAPGPPSDRLGAGQP